MASSWSAADAIGLGGPIGWSASCSRTFSRSRTARHPPYRGNCTCARSLTECFGCLTLKAIPLVQRVPGDRLTAKLCSGVPVPSSSLAETSSAIQAIAAVAQAVMSAGAVYLAARLQNRAQDKRDAAQRNMQLEGAASTALWALQVYRKTLGRAKIDGVSLQTFTEAFRPEEFQSAIRALKAVPVAQFGDYKLTELMSRLEADMEIALRELTEAVRNASNQPLNAVAANTLIKKYETDLYNSAAGAERRVAELVGRLARIDTMPNPPADW